MREEERSNDSGGKKRRRRPSPLHVSHAVAVTVAVALLLYLIALPIVVRHVVKKTFADLGFPDATFSVRTASLWSVELADVRPAGEATVIRSAMVRFSPIRVFGGRLTSIELTGGEVPVSIRDDGVTFALRPRGAGPALVKQAGERSTALPFDKLEVVASTLRVDWKGRETLLPVEGTLVPAEGGQARVELRTAFLGTRIPVIGTLAADGTALEMSASATNLNVAGVRTAIPWAVLNVPFQTSGRADVRAAYSVKGGVSAARVHVEPKNVWLAVQPGEHQVAVQRVEGAIDVELRPGMRWGDARGTLKVDKVAWDDWSAERVEMALRGRGEDAVEFEGTLRSEGWQLTKLKGTLAGINAGKPTVEAEVAAKGKLPARVVAMAAGSGVDVSKLGDATTRAKVVAKFGSEWGVAATGVEVVSEPGVITLGDGGVALSGVRTRLLGRAEASPAGVVATILPESSLGLAGARTKAGIEAKGEDVTVRLVEPAVIKAVGDSTEISVPRSTLSVRNAVVADKISGTNLAGVGGVLNVGGEVNGRKVNMVVLAGSSIGFGSLLAGGGDSAVHVGAAKFEVLPAASASLFDGERLAGRLRAATPVAVTFGATSASAKELEVDATATLEGGLRAGVRVAGGSVNQPSWALANVNATVPVGWHLPVDGAGQYSVGAVKVGSETLPAVTGTVAVVDKSVAVTVRSEIAKGAVVTGEGNVEWTPAGMRGRVATTMPAYRIRDEKELTRVWKGAGDFELTGTVSVGGEVVFNGPLIKPKIIATVRDGRLASKVYDLTIEGLNGGVTIDNFDPVSGPGLQRIHVDKLHLGKLEMSKGGVEFRVERPDSLHVERSRWSWVGGQVYTYDLRINPSNPTDLNAVVYADRLDLGQFLGLVAQGEATGKGQLYGRLPVRMNWPELTFGQGFLYATGSGGIQVSKADAVAGMLDKTPQFSKAADPRMQQVKARIIDALRNFNYETLKLDFTQKDGGLTASINVVGKGGTGPTAQELDLTVNLNGVDQGLKQLLVIKKALGDLGGGGQ